MNHCHCNETPCVCAMPRPRWSWLVIALLCLLAIALANAQATIEPPHDSLYQWRLATSKEIGEYSRKQMSGWSYGYSGDPPCYLGESSSNGKIEYSRTECALTDGYGRFTDLVSVSVEDAEGKPWKHCEVSGEQMDAMDGLAVENGSVNEEKLISDRCIAGTLPKLVLIEGRP